MQLNANEIVKLMFKPITDNKIIELIQQIGLEQPVIDETYIEDQQIVVSDKENSGITLIFKELDGYTQDGNPILRQIDFKKSILPFNLTLDDNYSECCNKLSSKAHWIKDSKFFKKVRIWTIPLNENKKINLYIHFTDTTFNTIRSIVIIPFNKEEIGTILVENED